jgi:ribosomal protein S18 acetylase RimI-like enzyme
MIRRATAADADDAGRLLHAFNTEFGEPTPGPAKLADRIRALLAAGETIVLLAGQEPSGVLVLRLRPALWTDGLDAYLEELYVVPSLRRRGIGRALVLAAFDAVRAQGGVRVDLGTGEDDLPAQALYESLGFERDVFYGRGLG